MTRPLLIACLVGTFVSGFLACTAQARSGGSMGGGFHASSFRSSGISSRAPSPHGMTYSKQVQHTPSSGPAIEHHTTVVHNHNTVIHNNNSGGSSHSSGFGWGFLIGRATAHQHHYAASYPVFDYQSPLYSATYHPEPTYVESNPEDGLGWFAIFVIGLVVVCGALFVIRWIVEAQ